MDSISSFFLDYPLLSLNLSWTNVENTSHKITHTHTHTRKPAASKLGTDQQQQLRMVRKRMLLLMMKEAVREV